MTIDPTNASPPRPRAATYRVRDLVGTVPPQDDWTLPEIPDTVWPAALTDLLKQVPDLQSALMPWSRRTVIALNRHLRSIPGIPPTAATVQGRYHSAIGLAVDRAALVRLGGDILADPIWWLKHRIRRNLWTWIVRALELAPLRKDSDLRDPAALGALFVLGRMQPWQRGFVPWSVVFQNPPQYGGEPTPEEAHAWLAGEIPPGTREELAELLECLESMTLPGPYTLNPIFGSLGPIRGSDGDWIAGSTLVELKVVQGGLQRAHVAQVLTYALLAEEHVARSVLPPITEIAMCLPRQRALLIGTPDEWLGAFGAPPARVAFPVLRARLAPPSPEVFAKFLAHLATAPRTGRLGRRRRVETCAIAFLRAELGAVPWGCLETFVDAALQANPRQAVTETELESAARQLAEDTAFQRSERHSTARACATRVLGKAFLDRPGAGHVHSRARDIWEGELREPAEAALRAMITQHRLAGLDTTAIAAATGLSRRQLAWLESVA